MIQIFIAIGTKEYFKEYLLGGRVATEVSKAKREKMPFVIALHHDAKIPPHFSDGVEIFEVVNLPKVGINNSNRYTDQVNHQIYLAIERTKKRYKKE